MTEEEMKEFQEFLEWKKMHAQSVHEKEHQPQNEIEEKVDKEIQPQKLKTHPFQNQAILFPQRIRKLCQNLLLLKRKYSLA